MKIELKEIPIGALTEGEIDIVENSK